MKKMQKDDIIVAAIIGIICIILISVIFMQFKTVEKTDIANIENMRESELRAAISEWKTKYEETNEKLEETNKKIAEYNEKIEKNEEASELIDQELEQSDMILGKTDVTGEGVIITLKDNNEYEIQANDLVELINELRYAGAEAMSINDIRILNTTDFVDINYSFILVGGTRISSPYVVKAIGNQSYLSSVLNMKDSGFIDKYTNSGKTVSLETRKKIDILKYNGEMKLKYITEGVR